jgi:predicted ABC-type transport system involved in lysophospholipase L1 biosynthesis ATPase subunit
MEHSKTQALNEAKETSAEATHTTDKLDKIANKLHQIRGVAKILSGNTEASDKNSEQAAIVDESIHGADTLDVIDARLDQIFDKLTQIFDKSIQTTDESAQAAHKFVDIVISLENTINELSYPKMDAEALLEQLKQSMDELTHAANQLTQLINESVSNKSQKFKLIEWPYNTESNQLLFRVRF